MIEISQALNSLPGDKGVIGNAVLTYEVLGQRDKAMVLLGRAPRELLHELQRHPDLPGSFVRPTLSAVSCENH